MTSAGGVAKWYSGKNIFITGGSGFVGLCLVEKLLRCVPNLGNVYLLMRPKRGKQIEERFELFKKNLIFEGLFKDKTPEQVFAQVKAIAGDVGSPNLGLSAEDRKTLTDNVNVIFHSAATLDFAEGLKPTVQINLLGTRQMCELASQCRNLKVFVHVSSAYVNAFKLRAEEIIYPLNQDPEKLIALVAKTSEKDLELLEPGLLGDHPNTYTITKHMAEHEVQKMEGRFPCTIVRPSMITPTWKQPVPGWTSSKNGPQGFLMGAGTGIIRRVPVGVNIIYDHIPVDTVVNELIVAGFHAGVTQAKKVQVYHCTTSTRKPFRWNMVEKEINPFLQKYALQSAVWYPHLKLLPSVTWFKFSVFFVHMIPAFFLDLVTRISGGKPFLMKIHGKINSSLNRLQKFIFTEWEFPAVRSNELQKWLTPDDQINFNIDVSKLVWMEYFDTIAVGVRKYLIKEDISNLEAAKRKNTMLWYIHFGLQSAILVLFWYLGACLFGVTMVRSILLVPLIYFLFSFV